MTAPEPVAPPVPGAARRIAATVRKWSGVTMRWRRTGEVEFRVGRREIGHLHGDVLADLPFPRPVADRLVRDGRARRHSWQPDSGWVSRSIRTEDDIRAVIGLFQEAYERAVNGRKAQTA